MRQTFALALLLASLSHQAPQAPAGACATLASRALPNTTITAQAITNGSFTPPGANNAMHEPAAVLSRRGRDRADGESQIRFEVWMPLENWNGKFAGVGNGGWAGDISYGALAEQLRRGYATASTNTGHEAGAGVEWRDSRSTRRNSSSTLRTARITRRRCKAKALVEAFYGKTPERAYFIGCSSGGYEGLMEAQRFPADYDGIVAGAPANNWTRLMAGDFDGVLAVLKDPVEQSSARRARECCIAQCLRPATARDGVVDGVLDDPRRCKFDPAASRARANQAARRCLTAAAGRGGPPRLRRAEGSDHWHAALSRSRARQRTVLAESRSGEPVPHSDAHYKWLVFADPNWDWKTFDFEDPDDLQAPQGGSEVRADSERNRSEPARVPAARRQAAPVSRLERSADCAAEQHRLLRERVGRRLGSVA